MDIAVSLVSGPFGALILSISIIVWITKKLFPLLENYLEKQNKTLIQLCDTLRDTVASHQSDRVAFVASLEKLGERIERVESSVKKLVDKE